ncbi:MAG: hypothetical protein LUQ69_03045 [Methanoregulaceae archaeon]|nr:hypothetical protein [Methanoregulaceae archaeon]
MIKVLRFGSVITIPVVSPVTAKFLGTAFKQMKAQRERDAILPVPA